MTKKSKFFIIAPLILTMLTSCAAFKPEKVDTRKVSIKGSERARKNIEEGGGVSINNIIKGRGRGGNFQFSSSNPMWRASLEIFRFSTSQYS